MPRRTIADDDWDDGDDAWRNSAADDDSDDEGSTASCPYCDRSVPEDLVRCPYCENYLSNEEAPPAHKPWWIIIGVVICLYIIWRWTVG